MNILAQKGGDEAMRNPRITRQVADDAGDVYDYVLEAIGDHVVTDEEQAGLATHARNHSVLAERADKFFQQGMRLLGGGSVNRGMVAEVKSLERWCAAQRNGPVMVEVTGPSEKSASQAA